MLNASIFDIDVLWNNNFSIWIIDKSRPSEPILKISQEDFHLIKNGVYKKLDNLIDYSGKKYYIGDNMYNKIKVLCKNRKIPLSNLGVSIQELIHPSVESIKFNMDNIKQLKNKNEDIFILDKYGKEYDESRKDFTTKLNDMGIVITEWINVPQTIFNRDMDEINWNKAIVIVSKFFRSEKTYTNIYYYDSDRNTIDFINTTINDVIKKIFDDSDDIKKQDMIKRAKNLILFTCYVTDNKMNRFIKNNIPIKIDSVIKKLESFLWIRKK